MPTRLYKRGSIPAFALLLGLAVAFNGRGAESLEVWQDLTPEKLVEARRTPGSKRTVAPRNGRTVRLNLEAFRRTLATAPLEAQGGTSKTEISLPMPDGTLARFLIEESPVMESMLAAKYPAIRTYAGRGIDNPILTARLDQTAQGFHAIIFTGSGCVYIDPYWRDDTASYISYNRSDYHNAAKALAVLMQAQASSRGMGAALTPASRTYRLAAACTGEYGAAAGGTLESALGAIVTTVNRAGAILERDSAMRLTLVNGEDRLVFLDPATDGYTNENASAILAENQARIDTIIGDANYDLGHVFRIGEGGSAPGRAGISGLKAQGATGTTGSVSDPFDVEFLAHQLKHRCSTQPLFGMGMGSCCGAPAPANSGRGGLIVTNDSPPSAAAKARDAVAHRGVKDWPIIRRDSLFATPGVVDSSVGPAPYLPPFAGNLKSASLAPAASGAPSQVAAREGENAGVTQDIRVSPTSMTLVKSAHRDIYVEIDWMDGNGHSHKPSQTVLDRIVAAFAREGYTIHLDVSNAIPHQDALSILDNPSNSAAIVAIRDANFNHIADSRYFYSIWCHNYNYNGVFSSSSGIADLPGRIHLVSLGAFNNDTGTENDQVGTFIHEFGHNLNQLHGGADNDNFKPNYISVMNYYFQLNGIGPALFSLGLANSAAGFNDYGYSHGTLPDLDENHLNETLGIGLGKAVDWNGDGDTVDTDIAQDLNATPWRTGAGPRTIITDFDNWGGIAGNINSGVVMPNLKVPEKASERCIGIEEAVIQKKTLEALRATRGADPGAPADMAGVQPADGFTIFNDGTAQTLVVTAVTPETPAAWISISPTFPMTIAPGGSRYVAVAANYTLAPMGTTTTRLLVQSNDPVKNPYPGGVFVTVNNSYAPIITSPTNISTAATAATLGGNVITDGGFAVTERGVVYSLTATNSDPLIGGAGVTKLTSAGTTGVYTVNATGLTLAAGYSFKAYAINASGTGYTAPVSTFIQGLPTIITPTSASIITTSATLGGNVSFDGGPVITERGVVYSATATNSNPLIGGGGVTKLISVGTTGVFTVNAPGLTQNTDYSFKAYATNSVGTSYTSPVSTFTTLLPAAITTQPLFTAISSGQTATLSVTTTGTGLSYQWYQGVSGTTTTPVGTNAAFFTTPALSTLTNYWVKVGNLAGSVNSNTATVTVIAAGTTNGHPVWDRPDENGTNAPTHLSGTATPYDAVPFVAGTNGTYNFAFTTTGGLWDSYLLLYSSAFNPATPLVNVIIGNDNLVNVGTSGFSVTLQSGVNYFAVTTGSDNNSFGDYTLLVTGPGVITAVGVPTVTTPTSASITPTSAILGGNVASNGGVTITERGVVYSITATNNNPLIGGAGVTKATSAGQTGVFTVNAAALSNSTGYSFKAYATNSYGTTYSTVSTFATLSANADLANLVLTTATLVPAFAAGTIGYTANVPSTTASLTVTPTVAQANATVMVNNIAVASATASGAIALNVGANAITTIVTAQGGNTKTYTVTVTRQPIPTTSAVASATTFYSAANQDVTLSALVTSGLGIVNEGTVTFQVKNGALNVGTAVVSSTVAAGAASVTYALPAGTAAGSYSIAATYSGGANFVGSGDSTHVLTVSPAAATVAAADANLAYNASAQNIQLSATVTSLRGTVGEGTVTFQLKNGATNVGTAATSQTVSGGNASATYSVPGGTAAGSYTIVATYSGGANFAAGSDNLHSLTIGAAATTTAASDAGATFNSIAQDVTLAASVASPAGAVNAGTVTFQLKNGAANLGAAVTSLNVAGGAASVTYSVPAGTPGGVYTVAATYNGSANLAGSADTAHTFTVNPAATTVLAADNVTVFSTAAQNVTLSAMVTSNAGVVNESTMTFQVLSGAQIVGNAVTSAVVAGGLASVIYALPPGVAAGNYSIAVTYNAGASYSGSSDNKAILTLNRADSTTVAADAAASYSAAPQNIILSAAVTSPRGTVAEGAVTFQLKNGATNVGNPVTSIVAPDGTAQGNYVLPAETALGAYTVVATYSNGTNYSGSSDSTHTLNVIPAASVTAAANANSSYSASAQSVTLSATVTSNGGSVNEGTVTFQVKMGAADVGAPVVSNTVANGAASVSYTLPPGTLSGTYTIVALYGNGTNYASSQPDSAHTLQISGPATTTSAPGVSTSYSVAQQSVSLNATVTSAGSIVNEGNVTFQLKSGKLNVGNAVTSATVSGGAAGVAYALPAGTVAGTYTIDITYDNAPIFASSKPDIAPTLVVAPVATTVLAAGATVSYGIAQQNVTLNATVASPGGAVNEGNVTFQLKSGQANLGSEVTSATVASGAASVSYALPAGTALGNYTIVAAYAKSANFAGSTDSKQSLVISSSLAISSQAAAVPNPAGTGQTVTFTVAASGSGLNYVWDFGDGSPPQPGNPATHEYGAAGSYSAHVTVTENSGQSIVSTGAAVVVKAPVVGTGADSDGDGFSDDFEDSLGTNKHDSLSAPFAGAALPPEALTISKPSISLNFAKSGSDAIKFSGVIQIPAGFSPAGQSVIVDVGGNSVTFVLTAKGSSKSGKHSLTLPIKFAKGAVADQSVKYTVTLSKGNFAAQLKDENLTGDTDISGAPRAVVFTLLFNNTVFKTTQNMKYDAKKGKSGKAK